MSIPKKLRDKVQPSSLEFRRGPDKRKRRRRRLIIGLGSGLATVGLGATYLKLRNKKKPIDLNPDLYQNRTKQKGLGKEGKSQIIRRRRELLFTPEIEKLHNKSNLKLSKHNDLAYDRYSKAKAKIRKKSGLDSVEPGQRGLSMDVSRKVQKEYDKYDKSTRKVILKEKRKLAKVHKKRISELGLSYSRFR